MFVELESAEKLNSHVNKSSDILLAACSKEEENIAIVNKDTIESEVKFVNASWDNLTEKLDDLREHVENVWEELVLFIDQERYSKILLDRLDEEVRSLRLVSAVPEKCLKTQVVIKV